MQSTPLRLPPPTMLHFNLAWQQSQRAFTGLLVAHILFRHTRTIKHHAIALLHIFPLENTVATGQESRYICRCEVKLNRKGPGIICSFHIKL